MSSYNEWDCLKKVVLGTIDNFQVPTVIDKSFHSILCPTTAKNKLHTVQVGGFPKKIIEETREDLNIISMILSELGVEVVRPKKILVKEKIKTNNWSVDQMGTYCPRDVFTCIGSKIIASPMSLRHRSKEFDAYRHLFRSDDVIIAPTPKLLDCSYSIKKKPLPNLLEIEPIFDAANIIRCNNDIFYLISNTGNNEGANWLQDILGSEYRVHRISGIYKNMHIDTTILPLREGLLLCNPDRVNHNNLPDFFKKWDVIYSPCMKDIPYINRCTAASKWIGMNLLSITPSLALVEKSQLALIKALNKNGIEVIPIALRHSRTLGGGPHCITTDIERVT